MRLVHADLHIHTCLSPCGEPEMSPTKVARQAREKGLDLIAVCDHNSAENVEATTRAGRKVGLAVIGGMEITSREEVHVLGLFREPGPLNAAQQTVHDHLPGENDPDYFGEQLVMDEDDRVIGRQERLLIGATDLTLADVVRVIHDLEGIAIAAHVDRPSYSILSQLGFIPAGLRLDGVEISDRRPDGLGDELPVISSSDAHRLEEIGRRRTRFRLESPTAAEIALALKQVGGRSVLTD
jgi:PHP family Zn ribbon phosphoesterase